MAVDQQYADAVREAEQLRAENEKFRAAFKDLLSVRDQFAMAAMQGCIASGRFVGYAACAADSYAMADTMLAVRTSGVASVAPTQKLAGGVVGYLNDMGTEQKLSFAPLPGAFEIFELTYRVTPDAGVAVRQWQHDETGRITETAECPGPRWTEVPAGVDSGEGRQG